MTVLALQAAKRLAQVSNWRYSNLEYQKKIHLAHMFHLGALERSMVSGHFEAWEYGPVRPELYLFLKLFGSHPVPEDCEVFTYVDDIQEGTETERLDDAASAFPPGNGPRLVAMTHRKDGAWKRH